MQFRQVALSFCAALMWVTVVSAQDNPSSIDTGAATPPSDAPPPHQHQHNSVAAPMAEHNHGGQGAPSTVVSTGHDHGAYASAARHHLHDAVSDKPVELYGNVFISLDYNNPGKAGTPDIFLDSDGTVIGLRGGTTLEYPAFSELRLFYQIESMIDLDEVGEDNRTEIGGHDTFVGATGEFGTVWAGKKRTAYTNSAHHFDHFHHVAGDYTLLLGRVPNVTSGSGSHHGGAFHIMAPDFLGYRSPEWRGLTGEVSLFGLEESTANGALDDPIAYSANVTYMRGSVMAIAAYETHENFDIYASTTPIVIDKTEAVIVGVMFELPWIKTQVGGLFESISVEDRDTVVPDKTRDAYYLTAQQRIQDSFLRLAYGVADDFELNDGAEYLAAGITQIIGKQTEAYIVYVGVDNKIQGRYGTYKVSPFTAGSDPSTVALGIIHSF